MAPEQPAYLVELTRIHAALKRLREDNQDAMHALVDQDVAEAVFCLERAGVHVEPDAKPAPRPVARELAPITVLKPLLAAFLSRSAETTPPATPLPVDVMAFVRRVAFEPIGPADAGDRAILETLTAEARALLETPAAIERDRLWRDIEAALATKNVEIGSQCERIAALETRLLDMLELHEEVVGDSNDPRVARARAELGPHTDAQHAVALPAFHLSPACREHRHGECLRGTPRCTCYCHRPSSRRGGMSS